MPGMLLHVPAPALHHAAQLIPAQIERALVLDEADDREHRRAEPVLGEDLVGAAVRVEPPVVERDQDRPLRQAIVDALQEAHVLRDGDRLEAGPAQHVHLLRELAAGDRVVVGLAVHPVVCEHRYRVARRRQRAPAIELCLARRQVGRRERGAVGVGRDLVTHLRHREVQRHERQRQQQERDRSAKGFDRGGQGAAPVGTPRVPQLELREVRIAQYVCHSRNVR